MNEFENLLAEFNKLKCEYHNRKTKESDKEQIERQMRNVLKQITDKEEITALDGETYDVNTCNVSGLYAIYEAIRTDYKKEIADDLPNRLRKEFISRNKYSSDRPYDENQE